MSTLDNLFSLNEEDAIKRAARHIRWCREPWTLTPITVMELAIATILVVVIDFMRADRMGWTATEAICTGLAESALLIGIAMIIARMITIESRKSKYDWAEKYREEQK